MKPLPNQVRILLLEDSVYDAVLIQRQLDAVGLPVELRRVDAEGPFVEALSAFDPHVVLADYRLPRFSGMQALHLALEHDPLRAVIIVTGHLSEEEAISCLRAGASSYVMKDNLVRLVPEVVIALDRAAERWARREAEASREASERRFRALAEGSPDAVLIADGEGNVVFWNAAATGVFGYTAEEVLGTPFWELVPERFQSAEISAWAVLAHDPEAFEAFTGMRVGVRKDGTEVPLEVAISGWREGERGYSSVFMRDVSARLEGEKTQRMLTTAIENTTNLMVVTDPDGRIEYANAAFERMTGFSVSEVLGRPVPALERGVVAGEEEAAVRRTLSEGRTWVGELPNVRKDGTQYVQRVTALPVMNGDGAVERLIFIAQDLTEERSLERQLRQAQKMEGLGLVAGGVAHDFNNCLSTILVNVQLLLLHDESGDDWCSEGLRDIENAASLGADLVRGLTAFARDDEPVAAPLSLGHVVVETGRMLRKVLPASIELVVDPGPAQAVCMGERSAVQQIVFNLANNARDAMPEGGRLEIAVTSTEGEALLHVRDTGVGMSPELLERVVEPFFTTKPEGKGTGLGLSMVHRLVQKHQGRMEVASVPGEGTSFTLAFPLVAQSAMDAPRPTHPGADGSEERAHRPRGRVTTSAGSPV